ncbi:hypothetical protein MNBD_GAMMA06-207 [hydrothermal vent metagenome]|uniref:Uncharacterized protein n=1 Tax=hydrothermal vent metagenome TaxID=652676 RepID=A0A3B0WR69_9ZZZZ
MTLTRAAIMATPSDYLQELQKEIEQVPDEYLDLLLRIVRAFREGVTLLSDKEDARVDD